MSDLKYENNDVPTADAGSAALLDGRSSSKHAHRSSRTHDGELPNVTFHVLPSRTVQFAVKILAAVGFAGLGGFLASEIPHTPGLMTNLVVLSGLSFLGSAALLGLALRDAFGRLTVDDKRISFNAAVVSREVKWSDVAAWRMSDDDAPGTIDRQLMFWVGKETFPKLFDIGWLNSESRAALRKVLVARLGEEQ
jgi:hypothetical protein